MDELKLACAKQSEKIDTLEKEIFGMKNKKYDEEMEKMTKRLNYQDDYSRRNNLRIDGVEESPGENWEVTQQSATSDPGETGHGWGTVGAGSPCRSDTVSTGRRSTEVSFHCGSFLPVLRLSASASKFSKAMKHKHLLERGFVFCFSTGEEGPTAGAT